MLWIAIHLQALPLEALTAAMKLADLPQAIVESKRILTIDGKADELGVQPGMTIAAALALAPTLEARPRQPALEAAMVDRLAMAMGRFTPSIVRRDDGLLLEVEASQRLFGGARQLVRAVERAVRAAGATDFGFAAAPTAQGAFLFARTGTKPPRAATAGRPKAVRQQSPSVRPFHERLDPLSLPAAISAWRLPPSLAAFFEGIGCRTLGDVRTLPTQGLQRRGAGKLLDLVARAYGDAPDPQTWYEPPLRFEMKLDLMHRADTAGVLVFAAQRLVQPLCGWLAQRWLAASAISLILEHERSTRRDQPPTVLALSLAEASRDPAQLTLLLREHLERWKLEAPVYALTLRLDQAFSHAGREGGFWRSPSNKGACERMLIDRLNARLGHDCVQRLRPQPDHRPELAQAWVSAKAAESISEHALTLHPSKPKRAWHPDASMAPTPLRPTWLLSKPLLLDERNHRPLHEDLPLVVDPLAERIEAGWFDGEPVSRDYHLAMDTRFRRFWIFRERRGSDAAVSDAAARWFLHGFFG